MDGPRGQAAVDDEVGCGGSGAVVRSEEEHSAGHVADEVVEAIVRGRQTAFTRILWRASSMAVALVMPRRAHFVDA